MRITIQPLFLVMLLCVALSGHIATYSLIMLSLFFHEFGHLVAARCVGVRIRNCEIMPYGGEITFINEFERTKKQSLIVSVGGPIASLLGIILASFLPEPIASPLIYYQSILLVVNCLPLWPLDGGRIVYYSLLAIKPGLNVYAHLLSLSLCFFTIIFLLAFFLFKQYVLALLSGFLLIQVMKEWRLRKYRLAFEKIVLNRLT